MYTHLLDEGMKGGREGGMEGGVEGWRDGGKDGSSCAAKGRFFNTHSIKTLSLQVSVIPHVNEVIELDQP